MNRKLIRPNLREVKEKLVREPQRKKSHPSYDTFAENYYYLKQMNKKTHMSIVFRDGEKVDGYIEWYDRNCIKLTRDDAPNLLVYKRDIKYIYKLEDIKSAKSPKKTKTKAVKTARS